MPGIRFPNCLNRAASADVFPGEHAEDPAAVILSDARATGALLR